VIPVPLEGPEVASDREQFCEGFLPRVH
jgi:hypothetical protein